MAEEEHYIAITYRPGTTRKDIETVDTALRPLIMSDVATFDLRKQPMMPSELRNPEIRRAHEIYVFSNNIPVEDVEELKLSLENLPCVLETIVGKPLWPKDEYKREGRDNTR